jgi:flagellin
MEGLKTMTIQNSINTNAGALIALQNLNATNTELQKTQNIISTGKKVANAKDDGAIWAIAQSQTATANSLDSVLSSLQRANSVLDVSQAAGDTVTDLLSQMKEKALAASDTTLDATSRAALNNDFTSLRDQITKAISNADFNGTNLIDAGATDLAPLANAAGTSKLTVAAQNLSLGGTIITFGATASLGTAGTAATMINTVTQSLTNVTSALARLGTSSKAIDSQITFVSKLQDSLNTGVGNLVDADLAKESAKFQALQTKQQLGVQALSIANQGPQAILSLFK